LAISFVLLGPFYGTTHKLVEPVAKTVKYFRNVEGEPGISIQKLGQAAALARSVDWDVNKRYKKGDIVHVSAPGSAGGDVIPLVVSNPTVFNLAKDEFTKEWKQGPDLRNAAREIGLRPLTTREMTGAVTASDSASGK
jgi:hypothetical protein